MDIQCPHCEANNKIEFADNICCGKCKKNFTGFSFRKYSPASISTLSALIIGGFITQKVDQHFFEANRYSIGAIYEIVNNCASPPQAFMTTSQQRRFAARCICALDQSMREVPGYDLKSHSKEFIEKFERNLNSCSD